jgi:hypothetical protein
MTDEDREEKRIFSGEAQQNGTDERTEGRDRKNRRNLISNILDVLSTLIDFFTD